MQVNRVSLGVFTNKNYPNSNVRKNYLSNSLDTVSFGWVEKIRDEKGRVIKKIGSDYVIEYEYKKNKLFIEREIRGDEVYEVTYGRFGQKIKEISTKNGKLVSSTEYLFSRAGEYRGTIYRRIYDDKEVVEKIMSSGTKSVKTVYENNKMKAKVLTDTLGGESNIYNQDGSLAHETIRICNDKTIEKSYENGELAFINKEETKQFTDEKGRLIETTTVTNINVKDGGEPETEVIKEKVLFDPVKIIEEAKQNDDFSYYDYY